MKKKAEKTNLISMCVLHIIKLKVYQLYQYVRSSDIEY
jgi:hypothetical protein